MMTQTEVTLLIGGGVMSSAHLSERIGPEREGWMDKTLTLINYFKYNIF